MSLPCTGSASNVSPPQQHKQQQHQPDRSQPAAAVKPFAEQLQDSMAELRRELDHAAPLDLHEQRDRGSILSELANLANRRVMPSTSPRVDEPEDQSEILSINGDPETMSLH